MKWAWIIAAAGALLFFTPWLPILFLLPCLGRGCEGVAMGFWVIIVTTLLGLFTFLLGAQLWTAHKYKKSLIRSCHAWLVKKWWHVLYFPLFAEVLLIVLPRDLGPVGAEVPFLMLLLLTVTLTMIYAVVFCCGKEVFSGIIIAVLGIASLLTCFLVMSHMAFLREVAPSRSHIDSDLIPKNTKKWCQSL